MYIYKYVDQYILSNINTTLRQFFNTR